MPYLMKATDLMCIKEGKCGWTLEEFSYTICKKLTKDQWDGQLDQLTFLKEALRQNGKVISFQGGMLKLTAPGKRVPDFLQKLKASSEVSSKTLTQVSSNAS